MWTASSGPTTPRRDMTPLLGQLSRLDWSVRGTFGAGHWAPGYVIHPAGRAFPSTISSTGGSGRTETLATQTLVGREIESSQPENTREGRGHGTADSAALRDLPSGLARMSGRSRGGEDVCEGGASPPGAEPESAPRILSVLSMVVERLVARNEQYAYPSLGKSLAAFHGVRAPSISIAKYLERIYKYTNCSPSCFVVAYIYIDRLVHRQPDQPVISLNIHRLLLTSVMVAAKVLDDVHYNNAFYARVGGVNSAELNRLELELLFRLDFRLRVSGDVFESYCLHLEKHVLCISAGRRVDRALPELKGVSSDEDESEVRISGRPPPVR